MVGGIGIADRGSGEVQVADESVFEAVNPAVNGEFLAAFPGVAHDGGLADIGYLLDDIELAEAVGPGLFAVERVNAVFVATFHVLDVAQPVVGESDAITAQHGAHAAATVVSDHHDVLNFQNIHGVLKHGEAVKVGVTDNVRDVAMHEYFSR